MKEPEILVRPIDDGDRPMLAWLIAELWGSEIVAVHGTSLRPAELGGFIAERSGRVAGLLTYQLVGDSLEIVTLNAIDRRAGIGTMLIEAAVGQAQRFGCRELLLTTTNDNVDALRESGSILVPTRTIVEDILASSDGVPDYALAKLEAIADIHAQAVARAYEQGVTIAMGTDIGLTGPDRPDSWGQNGAEPGYLVKLGMTPLEAIEATTATGPLTLGPQAPRSGLLAEGYDADVITLDADPLADIGVLADPDRVTGVWTGGRQVKGVAA